MLNARVYDVAIDSPLQKAVNMSNDLDNEIFFKVTFQGRSFVFSTNICVRRCVGLVSAIER